MTALRLKVTRGRDAVAAVGLCAAAALSVATFSNPRLAHALGEGLSESVQGVKTVAAMLAERSPGERPEGALASLKHKRQAALHQRALPKVRGPTAYETLAGPPPSPPIAPPPEAPLYTTVAGGPPVPVQTTPGSTGGGGPPVLSSIPPPGGGGGFAPPPIVTTQTPEVPETPVTPVPEPATWAMMILGFALIGRTLRRKPAAIET